MRCGGNVRALYSRNGSFADRVAINGSRERDVRASMTFSPFAYPYALTR